MKKIWNTQVWKTQAFNTILTIVGVAIACLSFYFQYQSLQEQKILGAWQLITTKAKGNYGKIQALEFLNSKCVPLVGVDLSSAYLRGVNLKGVNLQGVNFTNANLNDANFEGADLSKANFTNAKLGEGYIENGVIQGLVADVAHFTGVNLTDANFASAIVENTIFKESWIQTIESQRSSPSATVTFSPIGTSKDGKIFIELVKK